MGRVEREWDGGDWTFYSLASGKAISQQDQLLEATGVELEQRLSLNHLKIRAKE